MRIYSSSFSLSSLQHLSTFSCAIIEFIKKDASKTSNVSSEKCIEYITELDLISDIHDESNDENDAYVDSEWLKLLFIYLY